ncbi:condensation domain-containing protein [Micromonospora sp. NBS 11-29]|uniref:condensation domain-containing protein n=1 Tax=Micromonospora sp. NBS 11-29 TaxID=1960879 RepID=UPI001593E252|nr:condensation domain-containing protein [Micromonospora sp. NBS 11-29]
MTAPAQARPGATPAAADLAELFRDTIGAAEFGPDDSFFRAGGSSLDAMRLVARLHQRYGVPVTLADLFAQSTPRGLAERLATLATTTAPTRRRSISVTARRRRRGSPLSASQRLFHDMDRASGGLAFFNAVDVFRFTGEVDPDAVVAAVDGLVARQWALRTVVAELDGEPVQRVVERAAPIRHVDLRGAPPARLRKLVRRENLTGFDLHADVPARFTLVRVADDEWQLVSCVHHIAYDGVSRGLILDELAQGYAARTGGGPEPTPPTVQYVDFAEWQHDTLTGERLADHLTGLAGMLDRPAPRLTGDREPARGHIVRTGHFALPEGSEAGLRAAAAAAGVSYVAVLAAGLARFGARHTGQRRQVFGMQVANRGWPGSDRVVGCFSNLLPVAVDLDPAASATDHVTAVHEATGRALRHEEMPFEHALGLLAAQGRDLAAAGHLPSVGLAFHPISRSVRELPGCLLEVRPALEIGDEVDPTSFGLVLELWSDGGLRGITRHLVDSWPGDSFAAAEHGLRAAFSDLTAPTVGPDTAADPVGAGGRGETTPA